MTATKDEKMAELIYAQNLEQVAHGAHEACRCCYVAKGNGAGAPWEKLNAEVRDATRKTADMVLRGANHPDGVFVAVILAMGAELGMLGPAMLDSLKGISDAIEERIGGALIAPPAKPPRARAAKKVVAPQ